MTKNWILSYKWVFYNSTLLASIFIELANTQLDHKVNKVIFIHNISCSRFEIGFAQFETITEVV